jgi:hypothetical protein
LLAPSKDKPLDSPIVRIREQTVIGFTLHCFVASRYIPDAAPRPSPQGGVRASDNKEDEA